MVVHIWDDVWKERLKFCGKTKNAHESRQLSSLQLAAYPPDTSLIARNDGKYVFVQVVSRNNVRPECKTHGICTSDPHKLSFINFIKFATHTYSYDNNQKPLQMFFVAVGRHSTSPSE